VSLNHKLNVSWHNDLAPQWLSTVYVAILGFMVSVLLARELGVEDFGNYSYVLSLAGIFLIFQDGGYKTLIFRESIDDFDQSLLSSGVAHVMVITVLGCLLIVFLQPQRWLAILTAVGCMGLVVLTGFVSSLLKGKGDFKLDAIWKMVIRSLTAATILWVLFFFEESSITSLFVGWSMALLLALIWPVAKGYLRWPSFNFKSELFKSSMVFLTIDVATVFYFRSDIVLLEYFGNREGDVGQYSAAYRILEGIILLATPVAMIAFRALRLQSQNKKKFFHLFRVLILSMFSVAILIASIGALWGEEFMVFVFGAQYLTSGTLLFWLLLAMIFILPNYILTQGAIALNRESGYAKIVIVVAILNIVLNIRLIPEFGAMGAAWATIFAEGVLCIGLSWMLLNEWRKSRNANWS
jgi:O-antigen/teichoic acid export membrane protein